MPFRYALASLLLLAVSVPTAHAQACDEIAQSSFSLSDVSANLYNDGALFWRGGDLSYTVPKDGGVKPIFAGNLWVGGTVNGEPRIAAADFGDWEFRPGPLGDDGVPLPEGCTAYNRIYTVTAPELAAFEAGNPPSPRLADWPVGLGAPAIDAQGDPVVPTRVDQTVDLDAGERPVIYGTETAFWVMNDVRSHFNTGSEPLGVEVRVMAFLVNDPDTPALDQGSFYRVETINKSGVPIGDVRVAMWMEYDLGDFDDDYIASDPGRSLGYVYNADDFDDPDAGGYGVPPALGVDVLSGGWSSLFYENTASDETGNPSRGATEEWFNLLRGRWLDATPITRGGLGYNPGSVDFTRWQWDGDPVTLGFWTEDNPFGQGEARETGDRRAITSALPAELPPGASHTVDFAIVFGQGTDRLDSVTELRAASDLVQARYDDGSLFATTSGDLGLPPLAAPALVAPADGAALTPPETLRLEWAAVDGATAYQVVLDDDELLSAGRSVITETVMGLALEVPLDHLPQSSGAPFFWRVTPLNASGRGPSSETRSFTYTFTFVPFVTLLSDESPAFVEVVGPGGADPCGPDAESTFGCDEVGGNAVYGGVVNHAPVVNPNGTGRYSLFATGPFEQALAQAAPNDVEIRFTAEGSIGYHPFSEGGPGREGATLRVPFEIWDIGVVPPGQPNDPDDDVRLIPALFSGVHSDDAPTVCDFAYGEIAPTDPSNETGLALTDRIYGWAPAEGLTYADFEATAAPLVDAAPDGCYFDTDDVLFAFLDLTFPLNRPLQRFVLGDVAGDADIDALQGTVIRFYTNDPQPVADEAAPESGALALTVAPNPSRGAARVSFILPEPGIARVRVVDVLGREVAMLADGERTAGSHTVALPRRLAAGVYVVTVEASGERASRTLTVVR